jgi:hypothetical protein
MFNKYEKAAVIATVVGAQNITKEYIKSYLKNSSTIDAWTSDRIKNDIAPNIVTYSQYYRDNK